MKYFEVKNGVIETKESNEGMFLDLEDCDKWNDLGLAEILNQHGQYREVYSYLIDEAENEVRIFNNSSNSVFYWVMLHGREMFIICLDEISILQISSQIINAFNGIKTLNALIDN